MSYFTNYLFRETQRQITNVHYIVKNAEYVHSFKHSRHYVDKCQNCYRIV